MAKNHHKENLFDNFFHAAQGSLEALEARYGVTGVIDQVFGKDVEQEQAKANLRNSCAWDELSELYDYAVLGIIKPSSCPEDVVINGSDVIKLASSENWWPSTEWNDIIAMGDARFSLDDGQPFLVYKLALLAKVDLRTVRNAISAGSLVTFKTESGLEGEQMRVENASARRWLLGRRGFKPTVKNDADQELHLEDVNNPAEFGSFLVGQRKRLDLDTEAGKLVVFHPSVGSTALTQLEAGVFTLPLDAVFPLADFYQVSRKEMLNCVMRVFFADELTMLASDGCHADKKK